MATNKNALSDPYVKAIRWATDRIGKEGIVAYVCNIALLTTWRSMASVNTSCAISMRFMC
jgi:predicted helicase